MEAQARPRQPVEPPRAPRLGRWLLALALVALVAGSLWWAWRWVADPDHFPLRSVRVEGQLEHVAEDELRHAIGPHLGRSMLALDVEAIRRGVESLPWVAEAGVRREWPGTVVIQVRERVAVARWGEAALLSDADVVFAPAPASFPQGLPLMSGPDGSQEQVRARYRRLEALLGEAGLALAELHLEARGAWRAILAQGVSMELGAGAEDGAVERFTRAYPSIGAPADVRLARVDLRYPNGFALAWEPQAEALQ